MASKKPNMLEAFQQSARSPQSDDLAASAPPRAARPQPADAPRGHGRGALDPFAGAASAARTRVSFGVPAWLPVAVVVLLVAMAGTYWVARGLARESRAGDGPPELGADVREDLAALGQDPAGAAPATGPVTDDPIDDRLTDDDKRFLDKRNRYTVCAIQYANDDRGQALANVVTAYLRTQGFPAIAPIETTDGHVLVCVGAEPVRSGTLEQLRARLQALPGPPPRSEKGAFKDAYDQNIDAILAR
ncbi:MAG: hypothetical protein H6828_03970 [Planctomycetes bacterium]|nr:hypothetical protein [Planctomycetota bacterium]